MPKNAVTPDVPKHRQMLRNVHPRVLFDEAAAAADPHRMTRRLSAKISLLAAEVKRRPVAFGGGCGGRDVLCGTLPPPSANANCAQLEAMASDPGRVFVLKSWTTSSGRASTRRARACGARQPRIDQRGRAVVVSQVGRL